MDERMDERKNLCMASSASRSLLHDVHDRLPAASRAPFRRGRGRVNTPFSFHIFAFSHFLVIS